MVLLLACRHGASRCKIRLLGGSADSCGGEIVHQISLCPELLQDDQSLLVRVGSQHSVVRALGSDNKGGVGSGYDASSTVSEFQIGIRGQTLNSELVQKLVCLVACIRFHYVVVGAEGGGFPIGAVEPPGKFLIGGGGQGLDVRLHIAPFSGQGGDGVCCGVV